MVLRVSLKMFFIQYFYLILSIHCDIICFESENIYCLNQSESRLFRNEITNQEIKDFNEFLIEINESSSKYELIKREENLDLIMYKREKMKKSETYFKYHHKYSFNSDSFKLDNYKESINILEDFHSFPSLNIKNEKSILALALLHNFYLIEKSPFKRWLKVIPIKLDSVLSTMPISDLEILENDNLFSTIKKLRKEMIKSYEEINELIKEKWSQNQILSFFNHTETIPFFDWVLIYEKILAKNWKINDKLFLFVGQNFLGYSNFQNIEEISNFTEGFENYHKMNYLGYFFFLSNKEILRNQKVNDTFNKDGRIMPFIFTNEINENEICEEFSLKHLKKKLEIIGIYVEEDICLEDNFFSSEYLKLLSMIEYVDQKDLKKISDLSKQSYNSTFQKYKKISEELVSFLTYEKISSFQIPSFFSQIIEIKIEELSLIKHQNRIIQKYVEMKLNLLNKFRSLSNKNNNSNFKTEL